MHLSSGWTPGLPLCKHLSCKNKWHLTTLFWCIRSGFADKKWIKPWIVLPLAIIFWKVRLFFILWDNLAVHVHLLSAFILEVHFLSSRSALYLGRGGAPWLDLLSEQISALASIKVVLGWFAHNSSDRWRWHINGTGLIFSLWSEMHQAIWSSWLFPHVYRSVWSLLTLNLSVFTPRCPLEP